MQLLQPLAQVLAWSKHAAAVQVAGPAHGPKLPRCPSHPTRPFPTLHCWGDVMLRLSLGAINAGCTAVCAAQRRVWRPGTRVPRPRGDVHGTVPALLAFRMGMVRSGSGLTHRSKCCRCIRRGGARARRATSPGYAPRSRGVLQTRRGLGRTPSRARACGCGCGSWSQILSLNNGCVQARSRRTTRCAGQYDLRGVVLEPNSACRGLYALDACVYDIQHVKATYYQRTECAIACGAACERPRRAQRMGLQRHVSHAQ